MKDKCPFRASGWLEIWIDYQILQFSLQEVEELADANWNEILWLYGRIEQLKHALHDAGIAVPEKNNFINCTPSRKDNDAFLRAGCSSCRKAYTKTLYNLILVRGICKRK